MVYLFVYVVVATTKVHIFKQITTDDEEALYDNVLLLLPQRYIFSSKSQRKLFTEVGPACCCCYHKGTYFQANHNFTNGWKFDWNVVVATTKVHIFKQITTGLGLAIIMSSCCCYHKGTYFQANHNKRFSLFVIVNVVVATTKVHIFKQITTRFLNDSQRQELLLLPQRYIFSSKSQQL